MIRTEAFMLSAAERELLLRIDERHLVRQPEGLVWVDGEVTVAVDLADKERLRALWRDRLICIPECRDAALVRLDYWGERVVQELRVFGEPPDSEPAGRELLDDLCHVLGNEPVPVADVPALLSQLAPERYQQVTVQALVVKLARLGVPVRPRVGISCVDPVTLQLAMGCGDTES